MQQTGLMQKQCLLGSRSGVQAVSETILPAVNQWIINGYGICKQGYGTRSIGRVFVPIEEGATSVRENSVMPSYIFVRMEMNPRLYFLITQLQYVINFARPTPRTRSLEEARMERSSVYSALHRAAGLHEACPQNRITETVWVYIMWGVRHPSIHCPGRAVV